MKSCLLILLVAVTVSAAGCARNRVIVDTQNTNMAQYERDHAECETYASQVSTGGKAAKSAGFGAAIGAALGAIFGNSGDVARGAGAGGVVGGARGAASGEREKDQVLRNCLRGRGYRVLN
ncbi:MAG: glycine zipper family protein [Polycyclovorans sp.]|jgi:outer membrane lipoprotein SlyB|nr:glycine zipper family protein [Polycyclovorans sp.]MDP1542656.1 glycine zipper family protein [Polycyclovorans sp.]|tara:strand:+ start:1306 stop:1668 length:363 start_codon:yes stop_codon:yes gene_type:complete